MVPCRGRCVTWIIGAAGAAAGAPRVSPAGAAATAGPLPATATAGEGAAAGTANAGRGVATFGETVRRHQSQRARKL